MREFPMFLGVDHEDRHLTEEMGKLLEKYAVKGTRVFIELSPTSVKYHLKYPKLFRPNKPYLAAFWEAQKKGIKIIPLDIKGEIRDLRRRHEEDNLYYRSLGIDKLGRYMQLLEKYEIYNLRERHWINVIRHITKKVDIVIMHPGHLKRIQKQLDIPITRMRYFPEVYRHYLEPLTAKEFQEFRTLRNKVRKIRKQAAKTKPRPK